MNDNSQQLASILSKGENTPELVGYWDNKFAKILNSFQSVLSDKTVDFLINKTPSNRPFTPSADIDLIKFFDSNNIFNEDLFLEVVETSVRLLDNSVSEINFDYKSSEIVKQYRKIALSISNFDRFLELRNSNDSRLDEVDYLGNLLSSQAYRASESIAEEKGVCLGWNQIKRKLRPKSFEFWINTLDSSFEDALTIWETMNHKIPDQVWEIISRRNSHILNYGDGEEWLIWSDRDENGHEKLPETENTLDALIDLSEVNTGEMKTTDENFLKLEGLQNNHQIIPLPNEDKIETPLQNQFFIEENEISLNKEPKNIDQNEIQTKQEIVVESNNVKPFKIEVKAIGVNKNEEIFEEKVELKNDKLENEISFSTPVEEPLPPIVEDIAEKIAENTTVLKETAPNHPQYQIGELVTIINKDSKYYNQTGQVISFDYHEDQYFYTIRSTESLVEKELWTEVDIKSVDLFEILEKINEKDLQSHNKDNFNIIVSAFILNDKNELLLEKNSDNQYTFPFCSLPYNTIPEQMVSPLLKEKYSLEVKNIREIGSSVELEKNGKGAILNLSFYSDLISVKDNDNLTWIDVKQAQFSTNSLIRVICNKYSRSQLLAINSKVNHEEKIVIEQEKPTQNTSKPQIQTQSNTTNNMIQYILKLQQLVQNDSFGEVTVTFRYGIKGPQIEEIKSDKISPEVNYLSNVVVSFCNYILESQTSPKAIATIISTIPQNETTLPFAEFMSLMVEILEDLPSNPGEVRLD